MDINEELRESIAENERDYSDTEIKSLKRLYLQMALNNRTIENIRRAKNISEDKGLDDVDFELGYLMKREVKLIEELLWNTSDITNRIKDLTSGGLS